jgi:hypothetical protein
MYKSNTFPIRIAAGTTAEARRFYDTGDSVIKTLEECLNSGYRPLFMPEIAEARIAAPRDDPIWQMFFDTPSVRITGRGKPSSVSHKDGTGIVVYDHLPNYLSDPENMKAAVKAGLINGAGIVPQEEFERLLAMEDGERVFVVDHKLLQRWPSGVYGINAPTREHMDAYGGKIGGVDMIATNHPQTKPFLRLENAERYLERHEEVFGNLIEILHSDDLSSEPNRPLGRVLAIGNDLLNGLMSFCYLNGSGSFVGVREGAGGVTLETA